MFCEHCIIVGMGIKYALGKLALKTDLKKIFQLIDQSGLIMLPISITHLLANATLDFHHRDPFDRLLIAQAKTEGLTLLSKDTAFKNYNVELVWNK